MRRFCGAFFSQQPRLIQNDVGQPEHEAGARRHPLRDARWFGYHPLGKADKFYDQVMAAQAQLPPDPVGDRFQGGPFCSDEYDANRKR